MSAAASRGRGVTRAHARRTDPATSHAAAASVDLTKGQQEVLRVFTDGRGPMTDEDLVRALDGILSPSGARSRRAELVNLGYIVDTGTRVRLASGRMAIVWASRGWKDEPTYIYVDPRREGAPKKTYWICQVCLTSTSTVPDTSTLLEGVRVGRCEVCKKRTTWRRE